MRKTLFNNRYGKLPVFYFVIFLMFTLQAHVTAQDLIVTKGGDSIQCKIKMEDNDKIYYEYFFQGIMRTSQIPNDQVKYHEKKFYHQIPVAPQPVITKKEYPHFRIAANGGWSFRLTKIPSDIPDVMKDYIKNLKSGLHYEGEISYFPSMQFGFGAKFCDYISNNELDNVTIIFEDGTSRHGIIKDDIIIRCIGLMFDLRVFNQEMTNALICNVGVGYMGYTNNAVLIDSFRITGSTAGLFIDLGYDWGIAKHWAFGIQGSLYSGRLSSLKVDDGVNSQTVKLDKSEYESLLRVDVTIGLRFLR